MVSAKELTFIIQGKYVNSTAHLLSDIRLNYPGSKIILSVWEGDLISTNDYDDVIYNKDPGGFSNDHVYLNVNRQIVSTCSALKRTKTTYCIKLRSDLRLKGSRILALINKSLNLSRKPVLNEHWVRVLNYTTYNIEIVKKPLAICDWIFLGKTQDILAFFDIDLYPKEYFEFFEFSAPNVYGDITKQKYSAEQWIIFMRYMKDMEAKSIPFEFCFDNNSKLIDYHKQIISRDFIVTTASEFGVRSEKYKIYNFGMSRMMTKNEWVKLYKKYNKRTSYFPRVDFDRLLYNIISYRPLRTIIKKLISFRNA